MFSRSSAVPLAALLALLFLGTPSYAEEAKVTGTVTYQGKPLIKGRIFFHLEDGQCIGAQIKEGKYAITSIPKGTRSVTIEGKEVPAKYSENSSLIVNVAEGANDFNFELQ